jgi:hypothetical protein
VKAIFEEFHPNRFDSAKKTAPEISCEHLKHEQQKDG